jgi:hypothetical protein
VNVRLNCVTTLSKDPDLMFGILFYFTILVIHKLKRGATTKCWTSLCENIYKNIKLFLFYEYVSPMDEW